MSNYLYCGDNLKILRDFVGSATVDFCYIDPPFNSQRNYYTRKTKSPTFIDIWPWDHLAEQKLQEIQSQEFPPASIALFQTLPEIIGTGSLLAYLVHLTLVIKEIHRVLKSTGSFYLHCDPVASHYLKLVLDTIFCTQGGEFQNEIIWSYRTGGASRRRFARKHDVIFFYTKSQEWIFNAPKEKSYMMHRYGFKKSNFQLEPETGRQYSLVYGRDVLEIPAIGSDSKERLGFPTQKPEALLSYLLQASSNSGQVVLDAYCGCGTTLVIAQRLDRAWIGIDINPLSINLSKQRLLDNFGVSYLENITIHD